MFVNNDIRKEMYKGADANVDAQFKKLFIYHMENVSILFADIKVGETLQLFLIKPNKISTEMKIITICIVNSMGSKTLHFELNDH